MQLNPALNNMCYSYCECFVQPSADASDVFTDMQKRDLDELRESKNGDGRVLLEVGSPFCVRVAFCHEPNFL